MAEPTRAPITGTSPSTRIVQEVNGQGQPIINLSPVINVPAAPPAKVQVQAHKLPPAEVTINVDAPQVDIEQVAIIAKQIGLEVGRAAAREMPVPKLPTATEIAEAASLLVPAPEAPHITVTIPEPDYTYIIGAIIVAAFIISIAILIAS